MPVGMSVNYDNSKDGGDGGGSGFEYLRAKLQIGKGGGRVYFLDQMEDGFDADGNKVNVFRSMKFATDDLPKLPALPPDVTIPECQVVLDKDGKIVGIVPWNGSYKAKAIDLGPKTPDGSKPMPRIRKKENKNKPGTQYNDVSFWCIWQITDHETDEGLWVGATPYQFLKDKFYRRGDDMTDIMGDPGKDNTHAARLRGWGDALHLWAEDIPWPEDGNVLPELLRRIQERGDELIIIMNKGMVREVQAMHKGIVRDVVVFNDNDEKDVAPIVLNTSSISAGQTDPTFGKS